MKSLIGLYFNQNEVYLTEIDDEGNDNVDTFETTQMDEYVLYADIGQGMKRIKLIILEDGTYKECSTGE